MQQWKKKTVPAQTCLVWVGQNFSRIFGLDCCCCVSESGRGSSARKVKCWKFLPLQTQVSAVAEKTFYINYSHFFWGFVCISNEGALTECREMFSCLFWSGHSEKQEMFREYRKQGLCRTVCSVPQNGVKLYLKRIWKLVAIENCFLFQLYVHAVQ